MFPHAYRKLLSFLTGGYGSGVDVSGKTDYFWTPFPLKFATVDINSVKFIWFRLFHRTRDLYVFACVELFESPRFRIAQTTRFLLFCHLVYRRYISTTIYIYRYTIQLLGWNFSVLSTKVLCKPRYRSSIEDKIRSFTE